MLYNCIAHGCGGIPKVRGSPSLPPHLKPNQTKEEITQMWNEIIVKGLVGLHVPHMLT